MVGSREVRLSADYDYGDYDQLQLNYIDKRTMRPFANTKVYLGERLFIQTNSLRCFGPEPEPGKPIVGIFGDSVIQGSNGSSFVDYIDIPGCAVVNGGVEGAILSQIADRFTEVRDNSQMICAAVHSGFHNLIYNETSFMHWEEQFARIKDVPVVAFFRLSADMNDESIERGYEQFYSNNYLRTHYSKDAPTFARFREAFDRKNKLIEKMCAMWGGVLIDLDEVLAPRSYADIATKFFDIIHPSPEVYPQIGQAIGRLLAPHVEKALTVWNQPAPTAAAPTEVRDPDLDRGRNYPLW